MALLVFEVFLIAGWQIAHKVMLGRAVEAIFEALKENTSLAALKIIVRSIVILIHILIDLDAGKR